MKVLFIYLLISISIFQFLGITHAYIKEECVLHWYYRYVFHIGCAAFWPIFLLWVLISWIFEINNVYINIFKIWKDSI